MPTWRAFVINLDRATDRWSFVQKQLRNADVPFTRVVAVDGRALQFPLPEVSEWSLKLLHGRYAAGPEVGCYLSHIKALDAFIDSGLDYCLILEDDVILANDIKTVIDAAIGFVDDWDILRLSSVNSGRKFRISELTVDRGLSVCFTREKGAGAYLVNRKAAYVLRARLVPMRLAYDIAYDLEFFLGLKALFVDPLPVQQSAGALSSQIQNDIRKLPAWRYVTVFPTRTIFEVSRVVCRAARYLKLRLKYAMSSSAAERARVRTS